MLPSITAVELARIVVKPEVGAKQLAGSQSDCSQSIRNGLAILNGGSDGTRTWGVLCDRDVRHRPKVREVRVATVKVAPFTGALGTSVLRIHMDLE